MHSPARRGALLLAIVLAAGCDEPAPSEPAAPPTLLATDGPATAERDIMEFVNRQGTYCTPTGGELGLCNGLYPAGPGDVVLWCTWAFDLCGYFDYAGVWSRWAQAKFGQGFGETYSGKIVEHRLSDGRARVRVSLATKGAFVSVVRAQDAPGGDWINQGARSLGYSPLDWDPSLTPVLGDHDLVLEYEAPAVGAPIPDLVELFWPVPGYERGYAFLSTHIRGKGTGLLREIEGYPAGTLGTFEYNAPTPGGWANGQYRNLVGGLVRLSIKS